MRDEEEQDPERPFESIWQTTAPTRGPLRAPQSNTELWYNHAEDHPYSAAYCATKHAIESIAEGLRFELAPFGIEVATVNPGFYATGFNDRGVDSVMHWYDPSRNFTPPSAFEAVAQHLSNQLDPQPIADLLVEVALAENPRFRNVLPSEIEALIKQSQREAWG